MRADLFDGVLVFTRVAERRSFTAAAKELGITPAAVSWSIKSLEKRVGAPLLTRTTRSVGLTEAGEMFLEQARVGVTHVQAAVEAVQRIGATPRGLLRLSVPYVAHTALVPLLKGFGDAFPEIELELTFEDRFVDVVAEGYDAGIRIGEMIAQEMIAVRLTPPSLKVVVGSPAYFAERGRPERPEALQHHSCIRARLMDGSLHRWGFVEDDAEEQRTFSIAVDGPLIVNGPAMCVSAALSGVGLTYITGDAVRPLIGEGRLATCLEPFLPESPGLFIFFPNREHVLPKLRAFINFCTSSSGLTR
ncbi:LysR family transcriptional regulator [Sphingomonas phyllosphaerae]|uniref:LysR family transcriptional regulator n=1 Tax=Sphingomonas phyllosphaerae TaxID=257003 RepID=UPI000411CE84|nr:LysR family transcriptional regulator [Sphingomonas phyllosphaerae]